jgi:tagatose 1,6-diphosphate aldolase
MSEFKALVTNELTPFASAILLDPEVGIPATQVRDAHCGLILAYEKTGYDADAAGRLPDLLPNLTVRKLKELGADAVKILLYYDVDDKAEFNDFKHDFVAKVGEEADAEDLPFFFEIVTYDDRIPDTASLDWAAAKPRKVIGAMREFSDPKYRIDVLKVEVPVDMQRVEGFGSLEPAYSQDRAAEFFLEQSNATDLPFIFLSAGVTPVLFRQTLAFAADAGSKFNGVLCGRATWKGAVKPYALEGEGACREWLKIEGKSEITALNSVVDDQATPWR